MRMLTPEESEALLRKYSLPVAKSFVGKKTQVLANCPKVGFPLVLKIVSEDVVHKSDFGAVRTGIKSRSELEVQLQELEMKMSLSYPSYSYRFMIQRQHSGEEVIIGMKRDEQFGPAILFGLGGIFVEVFKDTSLRIAPVSKKHAKEMIREIRSYKMLTGFRERKKANLEAIEKLIIGLSSLSLKETWIHEIDLNPVIVNERKATIVDARMMQDGA